MARNAFLIEDRFDLTAIVDRLFFCRKKNNNQQRNCCSNNNDVDSGAQTNGTPGIIVQSKYKLIHPALQGMEEPISASRPTRSQFSKVLTTSLIICMVTFHHLFKLPLM